MKSLFLRLVSLIRKQSFFSVLVILIVMGVIMSVINESFASMNNILSLVRSFSYVAIMAFGMCMMIIIGGIDLSVGSVAGLTGILVATMMTKLGLPVWLSIILVLLISSAIGLTNAFLIIVCKLQPFIATMGMMHIARGLCFTLTEGFPILNLPDSYLFIGQGYMLGIPVPIWIMIILGIITAVFLNKTVIGRYIFAIGGNEEATRVSGVNVKKVKAIVYMLGGTFSGAAGIVMAARMGIGQPSAGQGYELDAIASVVIGGASLSGGRGTITGTIIGAAIMGLLRNALVLLSINAYFQQVIIGCVIIIALIIDTFRSKAKKQRTAE